MDVYDFGKVYALDASRWRFMLRQIAPIALAGVLGRVIQVKVSNKIKI